MSAVDPLQLLGAVVKGMEEEHDVVGDRGPCCLVEGRAKTVRIRGAVRVPGHDGPARFSFGERGGEIIAASPGEVDVEGVDIEPPGGVVDAPKDVVVVGGQRRHLA